MRMGTCSSRPPRNAAPATARCRIPHARRGKRDQFDPRARPSKTTYGRNARRARGFPTQHRHADDARREYRAVRQAAVSACRRELKKPGGQMPFDGHELSRIRAAPDRRIQGGPGRARLAMWPQSFNLNDILYWLERNRFWPPSGISTMPRPCVDVAHARRTTAVVTEAQGIRYWALPSSSFGARWRGSSRAFDSLDAAPPASNCRLDVAATGRSAPEQRLVLPDRRRGDAA